MCNIAFWAQDRIYEKPTPRSNIFANFSSKDAVSEVLEHAKKLGATAAEAAMSSTSGLSVSTRMGEVETIEFNQDGGLGISVYVGNNKGSASTADLNPKTLRSVVEKP